MKIRKLVLDEIARRGCTVKDFASTCPSPRSVQSWLYGKGRDSKVSTVEAVLEALQFQVVPLEENSSVKPG